MFSLLLRSGIDFRAGPIVCGLFLAAAISSPAAAGPNDAQADPMRPPASLGALKTKASPVAPAVDFKLRSILTSRGRRIAIINGRRMHEGDAIGDSRIVAIEPDRVRIDRLGEEIVLEISSLRIKRGNGIPATPSDPWIGPPVPATLLQEESVATPHDAGPNVTQTNTQLSNKNRELAQGESATGASPQTIPPRGLSK